MSTPNIAEHDVWQQALHFNQDDLEKNRQGLLSKKQQHLLMRGGRMVFFVCAVMGLLLSVGFYYVSKVKDDRIVYAAAFIFTLFFSVGVIFWLQSYFAVSERKVYRVCGAVSVFLDRHMSAYIEVDGIELPAGHTGSLFKAGMEYTVYYTENGSIVAVEENNIL